MKKVLFIMMLGFMFGQTKLQTKVYEFEGDFLEQNTMSFNLEDITNGDLSNDNSAEVKIFGYSSDSYLNGNVYLNYRKDDGFVDMFKSFVYFKTDINNLYIDWSENIIFEPALNHELKAVGGDFYGNILIAVTAVFPTQDTDQGDLNDDGNIDVLDVVNLVDLILFGDADPSQLFDAMKRF